MGIVTVSAEAATVLLSPSTPVHLLCGLLMRLSEWLRLYLRGKDDRRLWYRYYVERDGVRQIKVSVSKKDNTNHGDVRVVCSQFEVDSRAKKVCEFHV